MLRKELLSKEWMEQAKKAYTASKPYPHLRIEEVLEPMAFDALLQALQGCEFTHKESDLFSLAQTTDLAENPSPIIKEFVEYVNGEEFREWIKELTGQQATYADAFGAIYQDTDYLLCHDDQLEDRKVAYILYLTTLEEDEGGKLALYTDKDGHPDKATKRYEPVENSMTLFTVTDTSWHEVEEVREASRVSIGGWLRG